MNAAIDQVDHIHTGIDYIHVSKRAIRCIPATQVLDRPDPRQKRGAALRQTNIVSQYY